MTNHQSNAAESYDDLIAACGLNLRRLPVIERTIKRCREAVASQSTALAHVPWELITQDEAMELCVDALSRNGNALLLVPVPLRTEGLCLLAVSMNPLAIQFVPEDVRIEALCIAAVKGSPWALTYIPRTRRTPQVIRHALQAGMSLETMVLHGFVDERDLKAPTPQPADVLSV